MQHLHSQADRSQPDRSQPDSSQPDSSVPCDRSATPFARTRIPFAVAIACAFCFSVTTIVLLPKRASCAEPEIIQLFASDPDGNDLFGHGVAIQGDLVLCGAPGAEGTTPDSGAVYLFAPGPSPDPWEEIGRIMADDGTNGDNFGFSVEIEGDVIVVGAPGESLTGTSSGAAYVFRWNGSTWDQEDKLTSADLGSFDEFGTDVAISGDWIVVSTPGFLDGSNRGKVYLYRYDGVGDWDFVQAFQASTDSEEFGRVISIDGDLLAVATESNRAYLYRESGGTWTEEVELESPFSVTTTGFGAVVDVSAGLLAVTATEPTDSQVFIYEFSVGGWLDIANFTGDLSTFGFSLEFDGDTLGYRGATLEQARNFGGVWVPQFRDYCPSAPGTGIGFAADLAIDSNLAVASGANDDSLGTNTGTAFIFLLEPDPTFERGDANGDGALDISDPVFSLGYLFTGGSGDCLDAIDANDDGGVDISDPVYSLNFLFSFGPALPFPQGACGGDPTPDPLDCQDGGVCP